MKKTITVFAAIILFAATANAQQQPSKPSKPSHLEGKEVDSTKQRIIVLSQKIGQAACLTQGQAAELQQILSDLFLTIARKEEKPEPIKPKQ